MLKGRLVVGITALLFTMTGCSSESLIGAQPDAPLTHADLDVLQTTAGQEDTISAEADVSYLDENSSRFLAEQDGLLLYAGVETSNAGSNTCLVVVSQGPGQTTGGCDLNIGEEVGASYIAFGVEARLVTDDANLQDYVDNGWSTPHPNLITRNSSS